MTWLCDFIGGAVLYRCTSDLPGMFRVEYPDVASPSGTQPQSQDFNLPLARVGQIGGLSSSNMGYDSNR